MLRAAGESQRTARWGVSALVGSLHAGTIYHFRMVTAINPGGASVGTDQTFTTATAAPAVTTAPSITTPTTSARDTARHPGQRALRTALAAPDRRGLE